MPTDVTTVPINDRLYRVPQAVRTAALTASGVSPKSAELLAVLASGAVTETQLREIITSSKKLGSELDAEDTLAWANRVIDGIDTRTLEATLSAFDYNPEFYTYFGVESEPGSPVLSQLVRLPRETDNFHDGEVLTASGEWSANLVPDSGSGVMLDDSLVAALGDAITDGCAGLYVSYAEPLAFLEEEPLLTDPLVASVTSEPEGFTYAVVDSADTTAVLNVIQIKPGPVVFSRQNGNWVKDDSMLQQFMSAEPPPIVELSGEQIDDILVQVDAVDTDQPVGDPVENPDGTLSPPDGIHTKRMESEATVVASIRSHYEAVVSSAYAKHQLEVNRYKAQYHNDATVPLNSLLASAQAKRDYTVITAQSNYIAQLAKAREELTVRENVLSLVAAGKKVTNKGRKNRGGAEHLRRYWVRGKGAVKIAWGTKGDWYRCVAKLSKYLGPNKAKGYCNLRHKEATGVYPGDKRNK